MAMCVELHHLDGRKLSDAEDFPCKEMKLRKLLVPTSAHLCEEVKRRCAHAGEENPTCRHWSKDN